MPNSFIINNKHPEWILSIPDEEEQDKSIFDCDIRGEGFDYSLVN